MMLSQISILAVLAVCATAQNFTVATFFNISSVPLSTRSSWCTSQTTVCGTLCSGATNENTCSNADLTFNCTCTANNSAPGLAFYLNTIPTNECQSAFGTCIQDHPMDKAGQDACTTDIEDTCGSIDSTNMTFGSGSTSSSASPSATATASSSGSASSASGSATPSSTANAAAAVIVGAGQQYGLGALAAGALAAFGFML